jgi:predicted dehydrogenase
MDPLKIALLGTGKVAVDSYLPYLVKEPGIALGYYNRTTSKAQDCAARFGGTVFQTLDELAAWDADTVLVLTTETQRHEAAMALLDTKPRRVFFEKPLCARLGQENVSEEDFLLGREILQKAKAANVETAMVFNYRFFEHSQRAKRIIAERPFGKVLNVTGIVHYACWSHCIDLIHFLGGPIAEISALQGALEHKQGGQIARDVTAAFKMENGATGSLIGTSSLAWKFPLFQLTFNYEGGRIQIEDLDGEMTVMDGRSLDVETYRITADHSRWTQYHSSFGKSLKAYLESIRAQAEPPIPGIVGLQELQVEAAIKRSIAQSRPVTLAVDFPLDL